MSNLIYVLGASIAGYKESGPDPEEAMALYYAEPNNLGHAMMAQAFQMSVSWQETLASMDEGEDDADSE